MSRQNRVTPFGELIATSARGTLLGNRGCLHDDRQQIRRVYQLQRWIVCVLQFKGRHHGIMTPGQYTELFFLDEATALAAGHRPCAECQRERFNEFRLIWAQANPEVAMSLKPPAPFIDAVLHRERINTEGGKVTYLDRLTHLPDGTFIKRVGDETAWLVLGDHLLAWSPFGYTHRELRPVGETSVEVLTPRSTVRALAVGYRPAVHLSAFQGT